MKANPEPKASRIPTTPTIEAVSQVRSRPRTAATAIQTARTTRAKPRSMWIPSRPEDEPAAQPDPESGSWSQRALAIPSSSSPSRITTIAAPRERSPVDVLDWAVAAWSTAGGVIGLGGIGCQATSGGGGGPRGGGGG